VQDARSPVVVRPVEPADYAAWRPLWDGYNAFYERAGDTALPEQVTRTTWDRFFDEREPIHALVAEGVDGELVGIVHYLFHRSSILIGPTCYLQDLFTSEAARGRGVGRALIEAVYEMAQAAGASRVYWHTQETNRTARDLYDKVADDTGFIVYRKVF
jgi:GNAT superfamily N-acetyltransferase